MLRRFLVLASVLVAALSMIGVSALRASAAETPPTLSPAQGPAGTRVTASASDWTGCSSMSVSGWGQATLGTAAVSGSGAFTLSFTVPGNAALGAAQLVFSPTCSHSAILTVATFTVTQGAPPPSSCSPSVSLTPHSGEVGSKFVMAGKGWLPGGTVRITLPSTAPGFFESTTPFTPKVAANGTWQLTAIVGKPSAAGGYTFTYAEGGCASKAGTFTVTAPPTSTAPAAPSNLTATAVDQHDIKLTWHDNSSNETGFEINNGVTSRNTGANSTTYTWGGLAPGTYMCFKIRSYSSAGDSAWDPSASPYYVCTTTPKPSPPVNATWSGYGGSSSVTGVGVTDWRVPSLSCAGQGINPLTPHPAAAQWIGLGGTGGSKDLEQVGIVSQCIDGIQVNNLVWEILPQYTLPVALLQYPVFAGDTISAVVKQSHGGQYYFWVRDANRITGWTWQAYETQQNSAATPNSVEWVVEAQAGYTAHFSPITYSGAYYWDAAGHKHNLDVSKFGKFVAQGPHGPYTSVSGSGDNFTVKFVRSS